jgi:nucleotide-binding universal stress UspA family protein
MPDAPAPETNGPDGAVVFAYDGSEAARASILEAARQLAPGRRAFVITVSQPLEGLGILGAARGVPVDGVDDALHEATEVAYEGARLARSVGFDAEPHAETGDPVWRAIVDAAAAHHANLLVMGSHGRTGLDRLVMGSVASSVASHTDLPVMIVHKHEHDG